MPIISVDRAQERSDARRVCDGRSMSNSGSNQGAAQIRARIAFRAARRDGVPKKN